MTAGPIVRRGTASVPRSSRLIKTRTTTTAPAMATDSSTKIAIAKRISRAIHKATTAALVASRTPFVK